MKCYQCSKKKKNILLKKCSLCNYNYCYNCRKFTLCTVCNSSYCEVCLLNCKDKLVIYKNDITCNKCVYKDDYDMEINILRDSQSDSEISYYGFDNEITEYNLNYNDNKKNCNKWKCCHCIGRNKNGNIFKIKQYT